MRKRHIYYLTVFLFLLSFTGCKLSHVAPQRNQISAAENRLGIRITKSDPLHLFLTASSWVGTPYRSGGQTKKGADCSGFTFSLYKDVYRKTISRSSSDMYHKDCVRIRNKSNLRSGDLVFFKTGGGSKINHVGVYLKDNKFIHSATRGGVQVNNLNEPYYKKTFYRFGRIK